MMGHKVSLGLVMGLAGQGVTSGKWGWGELKKGQQGEPPGNRRDARGERSLDTELWWKESEGGARTETEEER
jgi:hypothetical protein